MQCRSYSLKFRRVAVYAWKPQVVRIVSVRRGVFGVCKCDELVIILDWKSTPQRQRLAADDLHPRHQALFDEIFESFLLFRDGLHDAALPFPFLFCDL